MTDLDAVTAIYLARERDYTRLIDRLTDMSITLSEDERLFLVAVLRDKGVRPAHRPKSRAVRVRDASVGRYVQLRGKGVTVEEAVENAAKRFHCSLAIARKAWAK
jgi:hypothetical protein